MTQIVKFPDRQWAQLATLAEKRDATIADLLVEATVHLNDGPRPAVPGAPLSARRRKQSLDWDEVARLNREGLTDVAIAKAMNRNPKSVFNARSSMRLPANRAPRKTQEGSNPA